jgi:hypothetical protein
MVKLIKPIVKVALLISLGIGLFHYRWLIHDSWVLRDYTPTEQIGLLAKHVTLTDSSKSILYANNPDVLPKISFSDKCKDASHSVVLGCYISNKGIYILSVTDEKLSGIVEVTTAHEMLHAAYSRLLPWEKNRVNKMLKDVYASITNKRVLDTLDRYPKVESVFNDELHSIIGTEIRQLPQDLEDYYSQYFVDRTKVLAYSEGYEKVFTVLKQQVTEFDQLLASQKRLIDEQELEINRLSGVISANNAKLDSLVSQKNISQYNTEIVSSNKIIELYNSKVDKLKKDIEQYNKLVDDRNGVALEQKDLSEKLDARKLENK